MTYRPLSDKELGRTRASNREAAGFGIRHTHDDFDEACEACTIDWHGRFLATIDARDQRIRTLERQLGEALALAGEEHRLRDDYRPRGL